MGIRVGIPVLKLSRNAKATKRKGDARKVALEAFNERYSKDQDLDRVQSKNNIYTGFKSGKDLYAYWEKEASGHLDTKGRHLRSDAVIGYTFIIKPDMESMENMTQAERVKFLQESMNILSDLFQSRGLEIDASALHLDEVNEHMHVFGHDTEYKAGKKIDIRLFGMLNKEYPKRMRELGYDVEDLTVYDSEKADAMTEDEKADYKEDVLQRKKAKKKSGRSSNQYKEEKLAEKAKEIEKLQAENRALRAENERLRAMIQPKVEKPMEARKEPVKAKESPVEAYKRSKEHTERYGRTIKEEPVEVVGVSERIYGSSSSSAMDDVVAHYMSLAKAKGTNDKSKIEKPVKTQNTASQKESLLSQTLGELGRVNRGSTLEDIEEKIKRNGSKDKDDYGFGF